jgi:hypothetical protein
MERKLKEHENRILVEETIQSCRSLRPREALDLVRKARRQLPAEERLLSLEGMLAERCRQQSVDERRDDYLSKAREALKDGQYSEAVSALELCEAEGIATGEILSLLEFARTEEADHRRQDQFRRNLAHAQGLIGEFSYDEAIEFLEGAIHQNDDTALHLLLDQATTSRDALRQQIDAVLASVASLLQAGRHGEAIQILETQPPAVLHAARAQATLTALVEERQQALYRMAGRAYAGLEIDPRIVEIILQRASSAAPGSAFFQSISESFHARGQVFADRVVSEAIRKSKELGRNQAALLQLVKETAVCAQFASPVVQAEWRRIEKKAARPGSTALFAR